MCDLSCLRIYVVSNLNFQGEAKYRASTRMSRLIFTIRIVCMKFCDRQSLSWFVLSTCLHNELNRRTKLLPPPFSLPPSHDKGYEVKSKVKRWSLGQLDMVIYVCANIVEGMSLLFI